MTKNQKMLLGVGAVAVVGYLVWKNKQSAFTGKTKFNASGVSSKTSSIDPYCRMPKQPRCTKECVRAFSPVICACFVGEWTYLGAKYQEWRSCDYNERIVFEV